MPITEARQRLIKEYKNLQKNPPPYITARPNESNILEWHYIIDGPPDTPYFNGQYHGVLLFTSNYPYAPPSVRMYTPSGRFQPKTRLCLSLSDFHPESWNPSWSVATILVGLLSFMTGNDMTTGSITTTYEFKLQCAKNSMAFNVTNNPEFCKIFPEYIESNKRQLPERLREIETHQLELKSKSLTKKSKSSSPNSVSTNVPAKAAAAKKTTSSQTESAEERIRMKKNMNKKDLNKVDNGTPLLKKLLIPIVVLVVGVFIVTR